MRPESASDGTNLAEMRERGELNMADSRAGRVLWHLHHWLGSTPTLTDDGILLERFVRQRDEEAFAELVSRHGPLVFGLCRRLLGNVQDAEDVFQAAFLVLARKAATIRKPGALSCFLQGVAYRLALKAKAEASKRRIHERQAASSANSVEPDLSWREVRGLLDEELQRLPEKQRLPLVLCCLEGLTQDEASRRLGWPRGTLKRRLESGRERLRLRLTRRGVSLGASLFAAALSESTTKGAVSITLRNATTRVALQFVTQEIAALAATPAAALAKGVLQTMLTTRLKFGAMAILLFGCVVMAAGLAIPHAPVEKQPESKSEALSKRAVEEKQVRKDRYGDPLPTGAIARLGTLRFRQDRMSSVVLTRDGKTAIAGDGNGFIVYWDVATGREIRRLPRMPGYVYALAISHDGKTLACALARGSGEELVLWDVASGKLLSEAELKGSLQQMLGALLSENNDPIQEMLFTPDDKTLVMWGWSKNTIHLWDVTRNKKLHELKGPKGNQPCIAASPDGKTLASASKENPHIHLWDIAAGKEQLHFVADNKGVESLAFSPDGKTLVSIGNQPSFAFFDPNTGKKLRTVKDYSGGLKEIAYAPDGKSLLGIDKGAVHVLEAVSGKHLRKFDAPPRRMRGLTISPDGKTAATVMDSGGRTTFDLWDVADGKLRHSFAGHRSGVNSLAFSADGGTLFSSSSQDDCGLLIWDATTGEPRGQIDNIRATGREGLAMSPDGKLLVASGSGSLRLLDPESRKVVRSCIGGKEMWQVGFLVWSADGKTLVSNNPESNATTIHVWDPTTGKQRRVIEVKPKTFGYWGLPLALSPDGALVAGTYGGHTDGKVHFWETASGKELRQITTDPMGVQRGSVLPVAFSPDGTVLACGGRSISLWEPATGRLLRRWDDGAYCLAFSSDGRTLVSVDSQDSTIRLWETWTGKERASFAGQTRQILTLAISRDGRRVATGSGDTTILVWDATGGARLDAALSAEQLQTLWCDLKDTDAGRAYRSLWQLAVSPKKAFPFLAKKLRPAAPLDAAQQKQANRLLMDLDSNQFSVRQKAEDELEKIGLMVEPALRKALDCKLSLEVRQRIEAVLTKLASERLRITRALEAIEHMNTQDVRRLLEALSEGAPHAWLTEEVQAIRKRMAESSVTAPER
jgi:RNA polymerase sigma factor (sigma-70 family)